MRLLCVFKGNKLLDQSDFFHPGTAEQFKQNVSHTSGHPIEELSVVSFEDEDLAKYFNANTFYPNRRISISKTEIKLIDVLNNATAVMGELNWLDCNDAQIAEHFSVEDAGKIQENKAYYNSIGNEKFVPGYAFNWPHLITGPSVAMVGKEIVDSVFKTIPGTLVG